MIKFIKSLLHGKSAESTPPVPAVELMSFPDILEHVRQLGELITPQQGTALTNIKGDATFYSRLDFVHAPTGPNRLRLRAPSRDAARQPT